VFIIGITGGSGAGKTSALRAIGSLGALVLDCDEIYHELLHSSSGLKAEIGARFPGVLRGGVIDRKALGEIVFGDPSSLADLNAITHKYVTEEVDRPMSEWEARGGNVTAIDAIALIESGRAEKCDVIVGVTAPESLRIQRIMLRDKIAHDMAELRIKAQKPDSFFKQNCDHILKNIYDSAEEFEEMCREFFAGLIRKHADDY